MNNQPDHTPITIDSMFAADPGYAERMEAQREQTRAMVEKLLAAPTDEERAVSQFLTETLGYEPPVAYNRAD